MTDLSQFLEEVYSRLSPEQVFEGSFDHRWQKTNDKWRGYCPWHDSKSGTAFYINTRDLTWYCPHCETGGGPIQYIHQLAGGKGSPRGKQFIEYAKAFGAIADVPFPDRELSPEEQARIQKIEARRSMLQTVISRCIGTLWSEAGIEARRYLTEERGLTLDEIKDLNLGLFPGGDEVAQLLSHHGHDLAEAQECGLVYPNQLDGFNAAMTGFVTFPWNDEYGGLLSIYGRWPGRPPSGRPKNHALRNPHTGDDVWLRSKKSPLFLDRALLNNHRHVVVVEGLFDVALLQVRGDTRAISWVAAHPSADQIATLKARHMESVTFCLDPDGAGDKGTFQGVRKLQAAGFDTYVVPKLPDGEDPDQFVIKNGIEGWMRQVDGRIHGLRFAAQYLPELAQAELKKEGAVEPGQDVVLKRILELARKFAAQAQCPDLDVFFWPEVQKLTGASVAEQKKDLPEVVEEVDPVNLVEEIASKHKPEEPPDYDLTLDEIDKLEAAEPDASKLHWLVSNYAYDGGLKRRGFSADYLLKQAQARRDRDGVMEGYTTRQILEMHPKRNWIVGGLIPSRSVVILAATGGIGKTSLIYDVEKAIALGTDWCEMPVTRGSVMNIQVDEPLSDTADKLREGMFYDIPDEAITWYDKWRFTQTRQLFQKIEEQKPSLVVIDSITAAHAGTGTDMISSTAGDCIYKLRDYATRCDWDISFWLVHHMSKMGTMRDSSTFKDNASEIQLLYKPTDDQSLNKDEYVLEFEKSRAGLTGKYVMQKDVANYQWIFKGLKDEPTAFGHMLLHLKNRPLSKFSPKRLADELSISYDAAHANLELARRFCMIESELKLHESPDGKTTRFRLYWGRSSRLHPEIAEVLPVWGDEEIDWGAI